MSPNDNSKNQMYLAGSFDILNILPIKEIKTVATGDWSKERFKASLSFKWIGDDFNLYPAPKSQLILYPKYPEVRFSGFLIGCQNPPSELMTQRLAGRLFFFGVGSDGSVLGYVAGPHSELAIEYQNYGYSYEYGVFKVLELPKLVNNKQRLINELKRIHDLGWIKSKRLDRAGRILPCLAPNCGGYTLEAELGITPNGYSEPDFLGWEIKQFGVANFNRISSAVITLMTPEPTNGVYVKEGTESFIRQYGYEDKSGKADRMNFGGIHRFGLRQALTSLKLELVGFDRSSGKIRNSDGRIVLLDVNENEAASWSFSSMLLHWNRKHNQACYIPSLCEKTVDRQYRYGNNVILGSGTDFQLFLSQMALGNIYYDPGIKMENASSKPLIKKRSQFRIISKNLPFLYKSNESLDVSGI
ncbi:MvaI/BcnI family restriction endonuclease [Pedobacter hiemivivus]|uniref:MvaI/BcnI family restriction endonuclease n=1 Tax=Pedobacter hiemivivus TaxID=2530454 RepID=UPI001980EEB6|nr:MvaI/BcnI family restriction endonuclease [Pedobacter hiemivivus]